MWRIDLPSYILLVAGRGGGGERWGGWGRRGLEVGKLHGIIQCQIFPYFIFIVVCMWTGNTFSMFYRKLIYITKTIYDDDDACLGRSLSGNYSLVGKKYINNNIIRA